MLTNYLKTACRNLARYKLYSAINFLGLIAGQTSCVLILLYVVDEFSFDRWLPDGEYVYRYETESNSPQGKRLVRKSALRAKRDLVNYFPQIEAATRIIDHDGILERNGEEYSELVWFVDPEFFEVFDLELLSGNEQDVLTNKSAMVISQSMANKYFADAAPEGQTITLDGARQYRVAGVFEDVPAQSHVNFDFIVPYDQADARYSFGYSENWGAVEGYTYLKLTPDADPELINSQLPEFLERNFPEFVVPPGRQFADIFQPRIISVFDIHLDEGGTGNINPPGNKQMLLTLALVAFLILVIAYINFINLSTIRSLGRAKEVAVRKALGAAKAQLVAQFIGEALLVTMIALVISIGLIELLLPAYNNFLNKDVDVEYFSNITLFMEVVFVFVLVAVLSSIYPAQKLSTWKPTEVLGVGRSGAVAGRSWLQFFLVMFQFAVSTVLVIATLTVLFQQAFINDKDLGFSAENKLVVRNVGQGLSRADRELIALQLAQVPGVADTTYSVATPSDSIAASFFVPMTVPGYAPEPVSLYPKPVDHNFFSVYDIPVISGREFSGQLAGDVFNWDEVQQGQGAEVRRSSTILNSTAVSALGFENAQAAIGKTLVFQNMQIEIIGVVPDVYFQSLRNAITPNAYIYTQNDLPTLTISYASGVDESRLVNDVSELLEGLYPELPIAVEFVENNMATLYEDDVFQFQLMTIFTILAIAIACLGLFALASYSTQQRKKEIGIRKVYGALSVDIVRMLLIKLTSPIVLANVLAWPIAIYAISQYLRGFSYTISTGDKVMIVLASSLVIAFIAWAVIVFHAFKASRTSPVTTMRE